MQVLLRFAIWIHLSHEKFNESHSTASTTFKFICLQAKGTIGKETGHFQNPPFLTVCNGECLHLLTQWRACLPLVTLLVSMVLAKMAAVSCVQTLTRWKSKRQTLTCVCLTLRIAPKQSTSIFQTGFFPLANVAIVWFWGIQKCSDVFFIWTVQCYWINWACFMRCAVLCKVLCIVSMIC